MGYITVGMAAVAETLPGIRPGIKTPDIVGKARAGIDVLSTRFQERIPDIRTAETPIQIIFDRTQPLRRRIVAGTITAATAVVFGALAAACDPGMLGPEGGNTPGVTDGNGTGVDDGQTGGPTEQQINEILRSECLYNLDRVGEPELCFEEYPVTTPTP